MIIPKSLSGSGGRIRSLGIVIALFIDGIIPVISTIADIFSIGILGLAVVSLLLARIFALSASRNRRSTT